MSRATAAADLVQPSLLIQRTGWLVAVIVGLLSARPVVNLISPRQIVNTSFDSLDLMNAYDSFGSVDREHLSVVFEGTAAARLCLPLIPQ